MEKKVEFLALVVGLILGISLTMLFFDFYKNDQYSNVQPPPFLDSKIFFNNYNMDIGIVYNFSNKEPSFLLLNVTPTKSMYPTISDFSKIILVKVDSGDDLHIGDIVLVKREGKISLLHRIVEIKDGEYITKGDNNLFRDNTHWKFEDIQGKVVVVVY